MRLSSNLKMVLLTVLIILLVLYILIVLIISRPSFSILPWYINFSFILSLAVIVGLAVKSIIPWKKSAEGEEEIYKELIRLPDDFIFLSDFHKNKKGNVDFVVIGPTGIFAIESKNTKKGKITLENDNIYINGSLFKDIDPLKQAYEEAMEIQKHLKESLALSLPVTPVLVFANRSVEATFCKEKKNGVFIMEISCLTGFLTDGHRDANFTPELCKKIKEDMNRHCSDIV